METFNIKSANSEKVLAVVVVNGNALEFQADNSEGCLPSIVGKSFQALQDVVKKSSHLYLEPTSAAGKYLLRYVTDGGDVIEISTDNSVCLYNGKLLDEKEKNQLFRAVKDGKVTIHTKADITRPVQVLPPMPQKIEYEKPQIKSSYDTLKVMNKTTEASADYDADLERYDWLAAADGDKEDAKLLKKYAYLFKYGAYNG